MHLTVNDLRTDSIEVLKIKEDLDGAEHIGRIRVCQGMLIDTEGIRDRMQGCLIGIPVSQLVCFYGVSDQ